MTEERKNRAALIEEAANRIAAHFKLQPAQLFHPGLSRDPNVMDAKGVLVAYLCREGMTIQQIARVMHRNDEQCRVYRRKYLLKAKKLKPLMNRLPKLPKKP